MATTGSATSLKHKGQGDGGAAAIGAIATGAFIGVRGKRDVNGPNEIDIANTDVDLRIIFKMFEELDEKHDCLKQYTW